jgi:two-component system, cell cycle response regulator
MRALVADDDPVSRLLFRSALQGLGAEVTEASDGDTAWEILSGEEVPAIALIDWTMPGIDGPELCRRLRARRDRPYVYAVMVTSRRDAQDVVAGFEAGADDFVSKPVAPAELAARVQAARRLLELHSDLEQSRSYLAAAVDHMDHGMMLADPEGRIVYGNAALGELFDAPLTGEAGVKRIDYLRERARAVPDGESLLDDAGSDPGESRSVEFEVSEPARRIMRWTSRPVSLPGGVGRMDVFQDVTGEIDQRRAQELLARTDPLTELANRRGFEEAAEREVSRASRSGAPLSVVVFDIDRFKRLNDVHGHGVGDRVLRAVARCLSETARCTDVVARWGGEELIALLPETDLNGARCFAERVRVALAASGSDLPRVTVSAGVSERGAAEPMASAIARADERLYAAKAAGRDAVR